MKNKILMIVNSFPPSGESGVQRPVKFLKYLARDGWDTYVVTPKKPVMQNNMDTTLVNDIPTSTIIVKTLSLGIREDNLTNLRLDLAETKKPIKKFIWKLIKPVNDLLFPFDKQVGWVPFALLATIRLILKYRIRNIYITASPYSALLCGLLLKLIFRNRIFWVADYRDAWQFEPELDKLVLPFRRRLIVRTDEKVLRNADYIVFTSPKVVDLYRDKYPWLTKKTDCITNGFDEDDFVALPNVSYEKFTFAFMGKLYNAKWNPITWLKVFHDIYSQEFQFIHFGLIDKGLLNLIKEEELTFYKYLGYKSHKEALAYAAAADVNVIVLNNDPLSSSVVRGKIFELIKLGKPILAIGPKNSVIQSIIDTTSTGIYVDINNEESIKQSILGFLNNKYSYNPNRTDIEQYSRTNCTKKLENIYLSHSV